MECHATLIYAHLLSSELDPDEVRYGQLLGVITVLPPLLLSYLILFLCNGAF